MSTTNNDRFNAEANGWDSNPNVQLATALAHKALLTRLPSDSHELSSYDVLEIGCGTGLLSLALSPAVRSLTAVDAAQGMIDVLQAKLLAKPHESHQDINNVHAVCALLEDPDDPRIQIHPVEDHAETRDSTSIHRFDLVISHLVLHHIPDLPAVLETMFGCLKPGSGRVMLTDFEDFGPEARKFHPEGKMDGVERHGIARGEMQELLVQAGFVDVVVETAFEMEKLVETEPGSGVKGPTMIFPFLICIGRRP
ncbi:S-adenosyl-L-methionine-dependent methyltransferase [Podospora appendiculata]|uniref:S-adenosyl-L-methionine-dependent methyltransferase n=1 Tax=Podospora appendiculata TaxID=314037 RepID=A0AAE1CBU8_9PEZI|nr:S-adenosyl-L-methionine-dependent methyltransferase [Podospora appendiculata]